jgi:hypothetical protein
LYRPNKGVYGGLDADREQEKQKRKRKVMAQTEAAWKFAREMKHCE